LWYSASAFVEGEVREKNVVYIEDHWDMWDLNLCNEESEAIEFIKSQIGKKYDWRGIFFSQLFNSDREDNDKWFCSEIVRRSLCEARLLENDDMHHKHSPNSLFKELVKLGVIQNG
jgi:hypothetical protein